MSTAKHKPGTIRWMLFWFLLCLIGANLALDELARSPSWYVPAGVRP